MSDYELSIKRSLSYLEGIASALADSSPNLSDCILDAVANLDIDIYKLMNELRADTPEQPDPTAETLQEAAAAITPAPLNADDIEWGEKEARAIAVEMDAEEIAENGYAYADAPVTIGSYSDVSDEDVRAAGGEPVSPLAAAIAEHDAEFAAIGQSNYDRIVSGDPFTSVKA